MIATRIVHNRWKAAALTAVSVVVGVVACESRLPTETQKPQEAKVVLERDASDATLSQIVPDTGARAVLLRKVAADGRDAELIKQLGAKVDLKESHMRVMSDKPSYTPYTDLPQLQNREEVLDAIQRSYPPLLRGAGISGRAILWTLIDQDGHVLSSKIAQSSGRLELDKAALEVAHEMKFKPALNHGEAVPVWIQLPVEFK